MTPLRNQLDVARKEYQSLAYPGNLANEILIESRDAWRISPARVAVALLALAASVVLVFAPIVGSPSKTWLPTPNLVSAREMSGLPKQIHFDQAMLPARPPSEVMSAIEGPLMACGSVFLNVGKDLAHRADALIQTM